jgi:hypothetical protein
MEGCGVRGYFIFEWELRNDPAHADRRFETDDTVIRTAGTNIGNRRGTSGKDPLIRGLYVSMCAVQYGHVPIQIVSERFLLFRRFSVKIYDYRVHLSVEAFQNFPGSTKRAIDGRHPVASLQIYDRHAPSFRLVDVVAVPRSTSRVVIGTKNSRIAV